MTFTATVSVVAPGAGTPAGSVEFFDGATSLGTFPLNGSGQATFTTSTLTVATHSITAKYLGNSNYNESTSSALSQEVHEGGHRDHARVLGESIEVRAIGDVHRDRERRCTRRRHTRGLGRVLRWRDVSGTFPLNGSGQATFTTSTLTVATHSITAKYLGNSNYNESTSSALSQEVEKADTSTVLTSSANPSKFGQSVTFTATVTVVSPGTGTPSGTVTFKDGMATLGTGTLNGAGVATFTTAGAGGGPSHHHGDLRRRCELQREHVEQRRPGGAEGGHRDHADVLSESVEGRAAGDVHGHGTVVAPGAGTASGTVTFTEGATTLGTGTLNGAGVGDLHHGGPVSRPSQPSRRPTAATRSFNGSTSDALSQVVNKGETTTTLVSSANPSVVGQAVTFTATVSPVAPAAGTASGTVTFTDGATTLGTGALNGTGVATFTTDALAVGHHTITATYGGDASFNASTSNSVDQEVQKADTSTALASSANPSKFGQSVTFTATVTIVAPGAGTASGTVTFKDGATTLGTGTLNGAGVSRRSRRRH